MGNFNRAEDNNGRGGRLGGRNGERDGRRQQGGFQKKSFGGSDRGSKEQMMHQATCSECQKRCEVPFRPVSGKPVYCTDCFSFKRGASAGGDRVPAKFHYDNRENGGGEGNDGVKRQLSEMNTKLDRLIKVIETFTGASAKPAFAKDSGEAKEKKSVDVVELKKVLDKATEKEPVKTKAAKKEPTKAAPAKKKK